MIEEQKEVEVESKKILDPKDIRKNKIKDQIEFLVRYEEFTALPRSKRFFVKRLGKNQLKLR